MHHTNNYGRLVGMIVLSFVAMYILMYAMVNVFANALPNVNQFYMAGLMTMPMIGIELVLMKAMYGNKKINWIIGVMCTALAVIFWLCIRYQVGVNDRQFLRSMIPHHAGAILMCENASIKDHEIKTLCDGIISGQHAEIEQMKELLKKMK